MFFLGLVTSTVTDTGTSFCVGQGSAPLCHREEVRVAERSGAPVAVKRTSGHYFGQKNLELTNDPGGSFKTLDTPPHLGGSSRRGKFARPSWSQRFHQLRTRSRPSVLESTCC